MGNFKSINAGTIFKLNIYRSKDTRVIASGRENDIRHVNMHVDGDELVLDLDEHFPRWNQDLREITVNISVPELEHIRLGGASKASIKGFDEDNLEFDLSGAANVDADIHVRSLTVNVEGAAKISLNGDGDNLSGKVNGASTLNAFDYEVKSADLNVSGASTARVHASEALEAEATGFGKIRYRGDPRLNIHGSGLNNVSKED